MRAAVCAAALLLAATASAQPGSVAGRVVAAEGGVPLPGATVRLRASALGAGTDADGRFEIHAVVPGTYVLVVSSVGFRTELRDVAVRPGTRAEVEVALTEESLSGGEVVVAAPRAQTATKTDAPVLLIPQAVAIVPARVIEAQGAHDAAAALRNASGVAVAAQQQPYPEFVLRGFETDESGSFRRNGVEFAHYHDGLHANVERVEVLKGPASVLYGRIEPGGVVNFVTRRPLAVPRVEAEGEAGLFGLARMRADATGPVAGVPRLLYRAIASAERAGSFRDRVEGTELFAAPSATWMLGRVVWTVEGEVEQASSVLDPGIATPGTAIPAGADRAPFFGEPEEPYRWRAVAGMSTLEAEVGRGWRLRHVVSAGLYARDRPLVALDSLLAGDRVARSFRREESRHRYVVTEAALTGRARTGPLDHHLTAGVELNRLGITLTGEAPLVGIGESVRFAAIAPAALEGPAPTGLPAPGERVEYVHASGSGWNVGLYGQHRLTAPLPPVLGGEGGQAHLVVAGRLSRVVAQAEWFALASTEDTPAGLNERRGDVTAFTPSAGVVVEPRPGLALYASYGRSFNPIFQQVDEHGEPFDPTRGAQVEAGAKTEWFRGRLTATLAAFEIVKEGALSREAGGFYRQTGRQRSRGIELDVLGEPLPGLTVVGALSLLDAVVTEDEQVPVGNRLPGAARTSGRAWAEYRLGRGPFEGLAVSAGLYALGARFGTLHNTLEVPGYAVVDGGLAYAVSDRVEVRLLAENVLDAHYAVSAGQRPGTRTSPPMVNWWPGAPRLVRLAARVRL